MNWLVVVIAEMHAVIIIQFIISQMVWVSYLFINMKRPINTYTAAMLASFWDLETFLTLNLKLSCKFFFLLISKFVNLLFFTCLDIICFYIFNF